MSEYRLKAGTTTAAVINADAASIVEDFADNTQYGWIIGGFTIAKPYVRRERGLNGNYSTSGKVNFEWIVGFMGDDAWDLWLSTFHPNGEQTVDVTVKTHARNYETTKWQVFNCKMDQPEIIPDDLNPMSGRAFTNVVIRFTLGTVAAAS